MVVNILVYKFINFDYKNEKIEISRERKTLLIFQFTSYL